MRSQRFQRSVDKSRNPQRVNTDTSDQDVQLLNLQIKALKNIWADEEEVEIKRGKQHNAIAQDNKDFENNLVNWSQSEVELTTEELENRLSQTGGQAYDEISKARLANPNNQSALSLAINGNQVDLARANEKQLIEKYGEDEYNQYLSYSQKNQPVIDKSARFAKLAAGVSSKDYSDDYFTKRGVNPEDYISKQAVAELHVEKYTQKAEDFIDGVKLTETNTAEVTTRVAERIQKADLPQKNKNRLLGRFTSKLTAQEKAREQAEKRASEQIKSDYLNNVIPRIKDHTILTDNDAKVVGNKLYSDRSKQVDDGFISWGNFKTPPADERQRDIYTTKYNQKVESEYTAIKKFAADKSNFGGFRNPENIPADKEFAVQLTYDYFNERRRKDKDFSLEDARKALFEENNGEPSDGQVNVQVLLTSSHRHLDDLGLSKRQYTKMFRTESGRRRIIDLGAKSGKPELNFLRAVMQQTDENYVTRRPDEQPRTN